MRLQELNEAQAPELAKALARALKHPVIQHLSEQLTSHRPVDATEYEGVRFAAVLAVVRLVDENAGRAELLFIKRAVLERDPWSGHVAFPGGRQDPTDASLVETALRETREELAMDIGRYGMVLGRLDDLAPRSPRLPPIIVRPFVAVVPAELPFSANGEVADAFWVPVARLLSAEAQAEHVIAAGGSDTRFPAYAVNAQLIWGLTERVVTQLLPMFGGEGQRGDGEL